VVLITAAGMTHSAPPASATASGRYPAHLDAGLARSNCNTGTSWCGWPDQLVGSAVAAASGWR